MPGHTKPKNKDERRAMKTGGRILGEILAAVPEKCAPGMTTVEVDEFIKSEMKRHNVTPAFLGYYGFPGHACLSVNDEVIHGIPGDRVLQSGDLLSVDCGVMYEGMALDSARTFGIGEISEEARNLIKTTYASLQKGLEVLEGGVSIGTYGAEVEEYLVKNGYGIVREFCGHGIGRSVHESPNIPNYGKKQTGRKLEEHMSVALEPMVTAGEEEVVTDDDRWTVRTADGKLSAHVEHTVLLTKTGVKVLTTT